MNTITAQHIATHLNAQGYSYFGDKARAYGDNIQFGRSFVRFENGKLSNNREGKARALTIGWPAVEACEKALAELEAIKAAEKAEITEPEAPPAAQSAIKIAKAVDAAEIGNCPRSVSAMLAYVPQSVIAKITGQDLAALIDSMWTACQDAKNLA